jgi:RimJ/RimL family protein N-acetyltransferase
MKKLVLDLISFHHMPKFFREDDIKIFRLSSVDDNRETQEKLYSLVQEGVLDDPGQNGEFESFTPFMNKIYYPCYWNSRDSQFIASHQDEWIGLSSITVDKEKKIAKCGLTIVKKAHRGQGVATMLKEQTVVYALNQGIHKMLTSVHEKNFPMLIVNQKLGFR